MDTKLLLSVVFLFVILNPTKANVIQIAHLQPNDPSIQHEPQVLQLCANDLKNRSILPSEISLRIITMESCNRYSGVENAAYLHYMRNASVYFGPGCNNGNSIN
ncbi:hypothetical protein M3Y94_00773300 [Aphelenchoides besseyi]|nr:hypothetical protein M3Y94_00773300 [Aphelenchoides besseyi]